MFDTTPGARPARPALSPALAARVRPVAAAASRLLPLRGAAATLFPGGALRRGSTTLVISPAGLGGTSLALAVLAGPSGAGSWVALVGAGGPGMEAVAEAGVDLSRFAVVPPGRGGDWAEVAGALFDGVDVVALRPPGRVRLTPARHLVARARQRQAALLVLVASAADWPEPADLTLAVEGASWYGAGRGDGHLRARRLEVTVAGRRGAVRPRRAVVWLPGGAG